MNIIKIVMPTLLLTLLLSAFSANAIIQKGETRFDSKNKLEYLGYTSSRYLMTDGKIEFFLAQQSYPSSTLKTLHYVAVHDVSNDESILDIREFSSGGFRYNAGFIRHYNKIIPKIIDLAPKGYVEIRGGSLSVSHHVKNIQFYNHKDLLLVDNRVRLHELSITVFENRMGKPYEILPNIKAWRPRLPFEPSRDFPMGSQDQFKESLGEANTIAKVLEKRIVLVAKIYDEVTKLNNERPARERKLALENTEKARRNSLTKAERIAEDKAKWKATEDQRRLSAANKGLIYRNTSYWKDYELSITMKEIFNGNLDTTGGVGNFPYIYMAFVKQYYLECSKSLPPGSPGIEITEQTLSGSQIIDKQVIKIFMKPKLWEGYKRFRDLPPPGFKSGILGVLDVVQNQEQVKHFTNFLLNIKKDMLRLYRDEKCDSGFILQFEENLTRLGKGASTLQKSSGGYSYFEKDKSGLKRPK